MKTALLLCALSVCFAAVGQTTPLPTDSLTHKVSYQGVVLVPGASAAELFSRAKALALQSSVPAQMDEAGQTVTGLWEKQLPAVNGPGRVLRYTLAVAVKEGRYRYALTNLENKTLPVGFRNGPAGVLLTAPGGAAPIERVLANPDGYRRGQPTPALLAYEAAVAKAVAQAVADVRQGMKGSAGGGSW